MVKDNIVMVIMSRDRLFTRSVLLVIATLPIFGILTFMLYPGDILALTEVWVLIMGATISIIGVAMWRFGYGSMLVAGYNTASKEERSNYDGKSISRFVGMLLVAGVVPLVLFVELGLVYDSKISILMGVLVSIIATVAGVLYLNIDKRFRATA